MAALGTFLLTLAAAFPQVSKCQGGLGTEKEGTPLRFTHPLYNATIKENSAPRTYLETPVKMGIQVTDLFWEINYRVVSGDDDDLFQAEALKVGDFCFLRIKTRSSNSALLNREVRDTYTLTVEGTENTFDFQAKTRVLVQVLDTNDLKPLFYPASYSVAISEDTRVQSSVVRVSATDADLGTNADFYYLFTSRDHPFIVDPFTGTVSLAKKLNHTRTDRYDLTVLAEDRTKKISGFQKFGNVAKVTVNVLKLSKGAPSIAPLPRAALSADGKVAIDVHVEAGAKPVESLHIVGGDPHRCFEVIPSQGRHFQVISTKKINWSENPLGLNLSLQAKDRSVPGLVSPVAQIHVPPAHYGLLAFLEDSYIIALSEFSPPKTHVGKVDTTPVPYAVTFSIRNNPDSVKFKINPKTGIILTTEKLDYGVKKRYEFQVVANHGEAETRIVVELTDENNNSPRFSHASYDATLDENAPVGSSVVTVAATDKDEGENGFVTYAIVNSGAFPFTIEPFTGVISTSEHLDYELMKRRYHLRVWASDSGRPFSQVSECPVTITLNNINDNVPLFERVGCNTTVPADLPVGQVIAQLSAIDSDELRQLRYMIESGNELRVFGVDPASGAITLNKPVPPLEGSFTLSVVATDGQHRSEASVVRVTVTNRGHDATVSCQETGVLRKLTDKLIESIKPGSTDLEDDTFSEDYVTNRHAPRFHLSTPGSVDLFENHRLNSTIVQIKASDADGGFNGMLVYALSGGDEDDCFSIDTFSGDLRLACPLDRERSEFSILNVTVSDLGTPQTSAWKLVAVNVKDVNDNAPAFGRHRHVVRVPEDTPVDSLVFTAAAVDLDADASVQYSLLTSTDLFGIDDVTGEVTVKGRLDRETSPRHDLRIQAADRAQVGPRRFSTLDLVVVLQDINDNPPKFVPTTYTIKVPEDVPVGTLLLWVESIDPDQSSGGLVTYNLKNAEGGIFHLDSSSGGLTLERELDYERRPAYNLTVRAVDQGLPRSLSSSCFVDIQVLDVNENLHRPVFSQFVYQAGVMEDAIVGTSVVTLTASDKDLGRDGVIRYRIHEGSGLGVFTIDEETGMIRTTETLDSEATPHYWLSVYATDLGTKPLMSWTHVYLDILDVNDNAPELSQPVYFAAVQENVEVVKSVVRLSATDTDSSSEGKLSFHMQESRRTFFDVDPITGVVRTLSALDREDKPEHIFEVVVSDNGIPARRSTATVIIKVLDANDNRPKFTDTLFHIKLLEQRHQMGQQEVCRMVARDDDDGPNAVVTYELQDNADERFQIDAATGVVTSHGDFWPGNYSILSVRATDQGRPRRSSTARLDIEWVAPPPPSAEPITFNEAHFPFAVMETEAVTYMVGIIRTETRRQRWFHITAGDDQKDFDIQRNTGTIFIARRLDAARRSNYNMTVQVTDGHQRAATQAYIRVLDMNEHRPVFLKPLYQVRVPEDTSPWKDVLQIGAEDADANSKLVFSVHSGLHPDSTKFFHLDPKSGVLVLAEELDYETISVHTLIVMVRDQEIPMKRNFVKVVVQVEDCNDHSPAFLSPRYEARVSNRAPRGSEVVRVKALDRDSGSNADVRYSVHSGNIDHIFSIDPDLGSIVVSKPLDLQPVDHVHLTVKATDRGFPPLTDICSVHINIWTSDHTPPAFPSGEYLTEISESSPLGTPVITISASSPAAVHYGIESGDLEGTFHINPYTGLMSIQKHLDFESCTSYEIKVAAFTPTGASAKTLVFVYVVDENDNAPVFHQRAYLGQVSESAHIHSVVKGEANAPLVVQASDADRDANALLVYQILEAEAQSVFQIDSSTGTISLISPADFEAKAEFHFSVQVKDSGEPSLYAAQPAKVTVHVLDVNDCPPLFTSPVYEPSVVYPAVRDAEVVRVAAHDPDSPVSFSIAEGNLHNAFSIQSSSGLITVRNVSEFRPFYQLVVKASDGLYRDVATVRINVTNLTASGLEFEQKTYSASIPENLENVQRLTALRARGRYLNEPLFYSVINPNGRFSISKTSGVLQTTGIPFDREEQDIYDMVVMVQDTRTPPRTATTQVRVFIDDSNDNAPQFLNLPFSMMISETSEPGDVLYQVTAIDRDLGDNGSMMYSLEENYNLFRIDPEVGDVSLQRPLDFEALNKYVLTVFATDEGDPNHTTAAELSIQVRNQTNPIFQTLLYPLKVPENVPPFTTILHVQARNPEGYRLIYNLQEESASNHFHVDFRTGVLTVTNPLDYESQTLHVLTVRATDSVIGAFSEASIQIEVEDVNDNAPVFSKAKYTVNIAEGLPVGSSVVHLSALDRDSGRNKDLIFQMVKTETGNETGVFDIDPDSGLIITKQVLDHEDTKHFNLKVKVSDKGTIPLSAEAYVFINVTDVNDNPPDFVTSKYKATLDEMAKCGHIVIKIQASDPDTGDLNNLKYKILSGNEGRYFNINESSGIISFSNVCKRNLDPYFNLTVAASDGVFQRTARVDIDMTNSNRHSPHFKQSVYETELAENAEPGTRVIQLVALDPDDGLYGSVDYTIINTFADENFAIDNNGQIITTQPLDRENPTQRVIAIKVMAKDGGGKVAFCTVKIIVTDENDNSPRFKASQYQVSIRSNVNKGSPVIQVMAYDADDGKNADVTYTVDEAEEVTEDIIEINPFTGVVKVKESLLGMENKIFNFNVKARDGSLPFYNSTVPVQVTVVAPDVPLPKFSEPLYKFSAAEDSPIGTEIGSVRANSDTPLIYSLVDGNTVDSNKDKVFTLDKESGTLLLQKNIDHETTKWYQIDVIAQGNHKGTDVASLVSISIQVQDVNDNQPVFDSGPYRAYLAENMPAGTSVIQVTANDPDTDTNGLVTYTLESLPDDMVSDITEFFSIDGERGWITTVRELDCEATRFYRFTAVAMDHGGDVKLSSSVLVEVALTDENDNPPKFSNDVYHGSVVENSAPGEVLVSMTTTDADVSLENRLVTCYITDGDSLDQFAIIQEDEGEWGLIAKERLDRETRDRYRLRVSATDGRFEAPVIVDLHVVDINDNSPLCEQLLYLEEVMENSPSSRFVLKVSATDPDSGANGQVSYSLHGPEADMFYLDHRTGELFTLAVLDREGQTEHNLVAKATDGGGRSCQADILLMIQDMNDNPPRFSSSHYEVTVFDNTTVRTPIAVLYAQDPDTGKNAEVRYALLGDNDGYYSLNEVSGILRLERPLTYNTPPTFDLKVKATDRGLPRHLYSVVTVTVQVVSLDSYQPIFLSSEVTVQLPETLEVGSEVVSIVTLTGDSGRSGDVFYRLASGNEHGRFLLDPRTGRLTLAAPLDYEAFRDFYLSVEGRRGKSTVSDVFTLVINVTDVNDNAPLFERGGYSVEVAEDLSPAGLVMKVSATDRDGPINNLLRYSIVSGDPLQQFFIHSRSGQMSVRTALDREEVPHYSLTVQAADEGEPPLSSAVLVTITVTDINDNPPVFSQVNRRLVLQEGGPVGSSILQLVVADKDTPTNGPPFSFHIVTGNEDQQFHVDQGGLLSLSAPLTKRVRPRHQLQIQATDSGHPPLSSICVVNIDVTEQSKYPPTVVPLEVFITTSGGLFANRDVGRIHASDQDLQDVLTYKLLSEHPVQSRFSVDPADGRIWVEEDLEEGSYSVNISVSDGKFSVWTRVQVHVWAADQRVLDSGVTLQLVGLTPEEFLRDHWGGVQRVLGQALSLPRQDLQLASLQQLPDPGVLEVLLVQRPQNRPVHTLPTNRLAGVIPDIEDSLGLSILRVKHNGCLGAGCPPRGCRNAVRLAGERWNHFTTARAGYITPPHSWDSVCPCNESALSFGAESYLKYLHLMDEDRQSFKLSLRFKTVQDQGVIMSTASSTHWGTLQLTNGELRFWYSCGNTSPSSFLIRSDLVSDGQWHSILLDVNSTTLKLTLDRQPPASAALTEPCRMMRSHGAIRFASSDSAPEVHRKNFIGCLKDLEFNGEPIRVGDVSDWTGPGSRRVFGVYQCCSSAATCGGNTCQNGGVCKEDANGEPRCRCPGLFHGARCQLPISPCFSQPCADGRVCVPKAQGYMCNCSLDNAGARCHNQVELCSPSLCPGGFDCKVTDGSIHCDPLPQVSPVLGYVEIMEICATVLGLLFLVGIFVCIRKRYVQKKKKPAGVQDANGHFLSSLAKTLKADNQEVNPMEMSSLDHTPFRSLRPRSQIISGGGVSLLRSQGPVVCSVAPNLPARPLTSSDSGSIRKNTWDMDYQVYPADPDYYGRPVVQELPQFDIVEDPYCSSSMDSRRTSRFGGFPFPLARDDRRAPLPPCYSNQNLDDFLGPDGLPLPTSQCPNEYTAISYYPTRDTHSLDNVSGGYKRLSMRLSVAMPSYAKRASSPPPPNPAEPQRRGPKPRSHDGSSIVESDYGSCEEVMF
ncbi:protocadherin Fat 2 [Brachionichthys hirsutus]|uniref:protocadherin Fat 2 n=1 Tax=Brachionichthys hirsutus TaxID=412623 RepID=UPI003604C561